MPMSDGMKWIKLATNIFDQGKIKLIEKMPAGDTILVIWLKILTLCGKECQDGTLRISSEIPYSADMLAAIFGRDQSIVNLALETFQKLRMIEIIDGVYCLPNWGKYQTPDKYELTRAKDRKRLQEWRKKQTKKDEIPQNETTSENETFHETFQKRNETPTEPEEEIEKEKEPTYRDVSTVPVDKPVDNFSKGEKRAGGHLKDFDVGEGILAFTEDCELRKALRRWSEMRAEKGKPLNPKTFQRNMDELRQLSLDPGVQKNIVDKSTEKGWIGFYPLDKVKGKPKADCPFCHGKGVYQGDDGKYYICNCKED
ncbi:phage replisome organizer N-terminal domain-containing protein [uncultured Acidaminococcus sp.]|uniref:phage replisome organizer N-terminal domain-containing protein n=1 Tax=uncultured Acidaminococcus sp. TaxID=352152 RepID=UPI0033906E48